MLDVGVFFTVVICCIFVTVKLASDRPVDAETQAAVDGSFYARLSRGEVYVPTTALYWEAAMVAQAERRSFNEVIYIRYLRDALKMKSRFPKMQPLQEKEFHAFFGGNKGRMAQ